MDKAIRDEKGRELLADVEESVLHDRKTFEAAATALEAHLDSQATEIAELRERVEKLAEAVVGLSEIAILAGADHG